MQKRTLKVALLAVLAIVLVLGISSVALADQTWTDLPDTVTAKYGITDNQVAAISEGYPGGLWKPYQPVTRAQFTKMAVAAFNIPLADPATASFADVPKGSYYYPYVEGAKAAGIVNGTSATMFGLNDNITRQQAIAIVARYVADANGYDLATMYTAEEIDILLAHFADAASISADLKDEVAFAFDMGLTNGDDYGKVNPLANLTRIQGAAFLIRAQALVPPNNFVPAKIELVSADKTEGLIGQIYSATFEVTDAAGHPAIGVLVDFDSLGGAEFYVGNVTQQAAMTNNYGQVTVDLISLEPGTQRVSASVAGVGTIYTTRYWLVIDEVYTTSRGLTAQNNAGVEHAWGVRVVVFGPGPRSTSQGDWYNAIDTEDTFDPTNLNWYDGIDAICDDPFITDDEWSYADELDLAADGYAPRTLAGIDVEWAIYDRPDNPLTKLTNEAVTSVGNIIAVDGVAITPAKTAVGKTDAAGYSSIKIYSEVTGKTLTEAVADYAGNPYPEQIFNHDTFQDDQQHDLDWYGQPALNALQEKTWISHTIGGAPTKIAPAYVAPNIGEEKTLTLTLTDVYGNPKAGVYVEWYMQGVGFFQTDDSGDTSDIYVAANNKDFDVTDATGKCTLFVKSYDSGEQIIHAKYRDKGVGGAEGAYLEEVAEIQWFDVDIATFDDITTQTKWVEPYVDVPGYWDEQNEALSTNAVTGTHEFCLHVYGLKLEYAPTVDYPDGQTPIIDSDATGSAYDGYFDAKDAAYFGGILMCPFIGIDQNDVADVYDWLYDKLIEPWGYEARVKIAGVYDYTPDMTWLDYLPYDDDEDGVIEAKEAGSVEVKVAGKWITLSFLGAYTMYDYNQDGYKENFTGVPGIYLPLQGKTVTFSIANSYKAGWTNLGAMFDGGNTPGVGKPLTTATATTDAAGKACVTISSDKKGPETIKAVVDWAGNPHNGPELLTAYAKKTWKAGSVAAATDVTIEIWIDGIKAASNKVAGGEITEVANPAWTQIPNPNYNEDDPDSLPYAYVLNSAHVEVHVLDPYGNDLPDYEVVYLLEGIDSWLGGSQDAADTFIPWAYLVDLDEDNYLPKNASSNPNDDNFSPLYHDYDGNGPRPDSDEPTPASDPYATIIGKSGTQAFFFNQWLGSEKGTDEGQPGLESWWVRISGMQFAGYHAMYLAACYNYQWPSDYWGADVLFDGFDGLVDGYYAGDDAFDPTDQVGLATDGAKAWTLDGYAMYEGDVVPNLLSGSNIDIQLADAYVGDAVEYEDAHLKSILRVMVYAPADGLVQEGAYIWSTQVHKVWEIPVPTTITLSPASDYAIAGLEQQSMVATVLDQFGRPMLGYDVTFTTDDLEGDLTQYAHEQGNVTDYVVTTDDNGNAAVQWSQTLGDWGVQRVIASIGGVSSNKAYVQWIYVDGSGTFTPNNLLRTQAGDQKVRVVDGFVDNGPAYYGWNGDTLKVYLNPGANLAGVLGSGTYVETSNLDISTNTLTWVLDQPYFVQDASSDNYDDVPNWFYDIVVAP